MICQLTVIHIPHTTVMWETNGDRSGPTGKLHGGEHFGSLLVRQVRKWDPWNSLVGDASRCSMSLERAAVELCFKATLYGETVALKPCDLYLCGRLIE